MKTCVTIRWIDGVRIEKFYEYWKSNVIKNKPSNYELNQTDNIIDDYHGSGNYNNIYNITNRESPNKYNQSSFKEICNTWSQTPTLWWEELRDGIAEKDNIISSMDVEIHKLKEKLK